MLLDRKRINKWGKWVALILAVVFAVSFVALGVGSDADFDWGNLWGRGGSNNAEAQSPEKQIAAFEEQLAANPEDTVALLGIANVYTSLNQPQAAASYLEKLATLEPGKGEVYLRLATIYLANEYQDYASAVRVLQEATALDPNNAEAFLQLGVAERGVGNINGAILAWNRYLELDPNGEMAGTVRQQIEQLAPKATESATTSTTTPTSEQSGG